jgi:hypothetical protein
VNQPAKCTNSDTRIRDNTRVLTHKTPLLVTSSSHHKHPLPPRHTPHHTPLHTSLLNAHSLSPFRLQHTRSMHHCTTVSQHHCITASLHHSITAPLHHCTTAPLHHCTTASLYHSTTAPLHHSTTAPLYHCTSASMNHCTSASLHHHCITVSLLCASMKPQRRRSRTNSQHLHYVFIMLGGYR